LVWVSLDVRVHSLGFPRHCNKLTYETRRYGYPVKPLLLGNDKIILIWQFAYAGIGIDYVLLFWGTRDCVDASDVVDKNRKGVLRFEIY